MPTSSIDLTNCDREPIHIPGAIQPHGVLLVLEEPELVIVQASENARMHLVLGNKPVLGSRLRDVIGEDATNTLATLLPARTLDRRPHYLPQVRISGSDHWSAAIHRRDDVLLLELEPDPDGTSASSSSQDIVRKAVADLDSWESLGSFCQGAADSFRLLTQCDRVMIYRFLEDETGVVIAEALAPGLDPYLGLRYPASDIPAQARELYRSNPFRATADVHAAPVRLEPALNPRTNRPLDLSLCALRATSPIHLEYLRNMGVAASLSFSILDQGRLWGLVACHHGSPKILTRQTRIAGEILVRFVGLQVGMKEEAESKQYAETLANVRSELRSRLSQSGDYSTALMGGEPNLLSGIEAEGVALCTASRTELHGRTPSHEQVEDLCRWIGKQPWRPVWSTHCLCREYPGAEAIADRAAGIFALRVAQSSPETVIWFRPEVRQTVNWAGNPVKPAEISSETGKVTLHPRRSFALWQEQVVGQSARWKPIEFDHVLALREDMSQALLKHRAAEVSRLNAALVRSNEELEHFAATAGHDLQEPLRTITVYTELVFRQKQAELDPDSAEMVQYIIDATKRMSALIRSLLDFARTGRREKPAEIVAMNEAVNMALSNIRSTAVERNADIRCGALPEVRAHLDQLVRVFQNLISNALKYCPADRTPVVEIAAEKRGREWVISVRDNGAGFEASQAEAIFQSFYRLHSNSESGSGLGLAICRKIVGSFGGRIWAQSEPGQGAVFCWTMPVL